ncbi:Opaque-specific ABC transporter cdr3 [Yamadazyma tenuis]|uniref:Pleiotropic drug resistance protein PDR n=1 Tax=Candida tenuis (strain ATCC 10573 / BCRC 21748 / CBS 615 / JCM 9827 / NBRC 10315 / NRRL Y-1498 / VKM Y-70) TaxID=590646 RepID=G3B3B2_CANTC|nr:pleiotropic drug resistance protein PDR [Yamadazyma tenuis ATCC 10573]XP_006686755.1 uncharacterized protein CANTEDRAFT_122292 [Yamadazyma tenuis ATCC 10573]EGV64440.1 pleiotropic drug resistance protein PDR [Yamadazyma tenuis ATCC 10573]EGV64441.1 hypothetical protein CANTEDRAFT_122292 [Yamadazyma tenuis ATCC 10573]WEJ96238.1 Opaque-specific ABC transporter cdr3 [Yamadazyma tenuis]
MDSDQLEKADTGSLSSVSKTELYNGFSTEVQSNIQHLARRFSRTSGNDKDLGLTRTLTSMSDAPGISTFGISEGEIDPRLDPNSDSFDSKLWVKNMRKLIETDEDYYKPSSLGVAFKDLRCYGSATDMDYQSNFLNGLMKICTQTIRKINSDDSKNMFDILKPMEGLIRPGELTVVLGRPGAGCSTFLKTVAVQTYGFKIAKESLISYDGISPKEMDKHYAGEIVYCSETENHFPLLTVGETLKFASTMRTPQNRPLGVTREQYAEHMADMVMATYGLLHTKNSHVGNDFIRGVSGGERKRVSIAEAALSQSKVQCWDNSTRGLDSATALEFVRALQTSAKIQKITPLIAIYQCSQDAYDCFDKVLLLYEGYEIYFGSARTAKQYFLDMGFECPARQTTADYLTSITSPAERVTMSGFEGKVPVTPKEFYDYWRASPQRADLLTEIDQYLIEKKDHKSEFQAMHRARQAKSARPGSPYTVSYGMQVKYIFHRNYLRFVGNPSISIFQVVGNVIMSLIISSVFYNLPAVTSSFYYRTAILFFATLVNAFSSILEVFSLYEARPIVEKHKTYALYHPSADAFASILFELPAKLISSVAFNLVIYFMCNLKRQPGAFFFFILMGFSATLTMSHIFRTLGAATKTLSQAMTPAGVMLLILVIYTGFVIPYPNMLGWSKWIKYLDPISYTFESLIANEFHGREYKCDGYTPSGPGYPTNGTSIACSVVGAELGAKYVNGDRYIYESYQYEWGHAWRNFGINIIFLLFFLGSYLVLCEYNKGARQKGEILLFQRSKLRKLKAVNDIESGGSEKNTAFEASNSDESLDEKFIAKNENIFHWRHLTYEIDIKKETRTILNGVDGWVKPGQVTALMGASGAGKTTLLNALSERLTVGKITNGTRMVNGHELDSSFQRSIGYVQQQDLHLETATVKESLRFSAYLRQPDSVSKAEKDNYVEYIIKLLEMESYADAVVGVAGEGLNVEQRKRLTIAVELVAKPKLLVFLDEPTSGLDSQTAWSICKLIRKLADHGQAILCTIHQPSAILLKEFDRLLFLQKGGQTVYFGDLGEECKTLIDYFEKYGAHKCPPDANPAEWMLEIVGAAPGSHANQDYHQVWKNSTEYSDVQNELNHMETELSKLPRDQSKDDLNSYATAIYKQYFIVTKRVFQQYWRTNNYLYSKFIMVIATSLMNGFSFFKADKSLQGLQNQMFSIFMMLTIFQTLVTQYLPIFVKQRDLYEVRERPAKTFSWIAFFLAQITAEIPWAFAAGTVTFFCWYYPIGYYNNAVPTDSVNSRGALAWWLLCLFYVYSSSMAQLVISFNEIEDNAGNLANLMFSFCLMFCGVLASSSAMPGFWIFMYRCNPFTYFVSALLSTALAESDVTCSDKELTTFLPPEGSTCAEYMKDYIASIGGGYLTEPSSTTECNFCKMSSTDQFLAAIGSNFDKRYRDMGIFIAFIIIDYILALFLYWLTRVPKKSRQRKT